MEQVLLFFVPFLCLSLLILATRFNLRSFRVLYREPIQTLAHMFTYNGM